MKKRPSNRPAIKPKSPTTLGVDTRLKGYEDLLAGGIQFLHWAIFSACTLAGFFVCWKKDPSIGLPLILAGIFLPVSLKWVGRLRPVTQYGALVVGVLCMVESLAAVRDYAAILPAGLVLHLGKLGPSVFIVGCFLIFAGFRAAPAGGPTRDLARWQAWMGVGFLMAFSLATSLHNLDVPNGYYCDDQAAPIEDTCKVRELHDYMVIMPYSFREPAGVYMTAFLWDLLPWESGFHMQRLCGVVTAVLIIWLMYLLGVEISGRRLGFLAAALITFSKWVPAEVISGYFTVSTTLAVCWALLAFVKIIKRPTWFNFLHWAIAVSFGTYTYTAFRLFGFFIVFALLILVLIRGTGRSDRMGRALCLGLGIFWLFGFLAANRIFGFAFTGFVTRPIVLGASFASMAFMLIKSFQGFLRKGVNELALKYFFALFVVSVLIFPLVTNHDYGSEVARLNIFNNGVDGLWPVLKKIGFTFQAHFLGQGIFGTSALDLQTACVVILGILSFAARPGWREIFAFLVLCVGVAPHFLADYTYNGRAAAGVPAAFFLAAWALERLRFWGGLIWNPKSWKIFFAALLLAGFGWEAWTNYEMIYGHQIYARWIEALVSREVVRDSPADRVYLSLYPYASSPACQGILDEGHPLFILHDSNPIFRTPGQPLKPVVVIVFHGDRKLTERLRRDFPKAEWTGINCSTFGYPDNGDGGDGSGPRFYRVFIQPDQISKDPKSLIYDDVGSTPDNGWRRIFYWADNGLAHGAINYEDVVSTLGDPFPGTDGISTAEFKGTFVAPVGGHYQFSLRTACVVVLSVGGRRVIDLRPNGERDLYQENTIFLKRGSYPVDYRLFLRYSNSIPVIRVDGPGSAGDLKLTDFSK